MKTEDMLAAARRLAAWFSPQPTAAGNSASVWAVPCRHEGKVLEYRHGCSSELRHVRVCAIFGKCTRGPYHSGVMACVKSDRTRCGRYEALPADLE